MAPLPDLTQFLADTANVSVLITDASGRIVWANAGFRRISGYSLRSIRGASRVRSFRAPTPTRIVCDS
ncbi:MAG: PAS domain-containing protein [Phycisphaerales bacterium]